jgi:putative flavoprotein involved in K+ transport
MYRGRDILWWMDAAGVFSDGLADVDSIARARRLPSMQLIGSSDRRTLDLNALSAQGIQVRGRLVGISNGNAQFAGSLANMLQLADLKMNRLLARVDAWADAAGINDEVGPPQRFLPTRLPDKAPLNLDLTDGRYSTVLWATGFRPDHSWLDVPVFDHKGRIRHDGGVVDAPGLYLLGMPFLRTRKSTLIDGAADDARFLSSHLNQYLDAAASRRLRVSVAG